MRAGALATRDAYDRAVCVPWMSPDVVGFVCPRRFDPEPASHVLALLILRLLCANCESSGDGRVGHLQPFSKVLFICVREMALVEARQWKNGPPPRARGWAITWGQPRGLDLICQKVIDE